MESHLLSASHSLCLPPSLPAAPSRHVCDAELLIIQWQKKKKKRPSIILRDDICIHGVETKEVTADCQREHMEDAEREKLTLFVKAVKDYGSCGSGMKKCHVATVND